jgi:hypothetical protein
LDRVCNEKEIYLNTDTWRKYTLFWNYEHTKLHKINKVDISKWKEKKEEFFENRKKGTMIK